jgi:peptide/nickel transport system substrate-binding protein
MRRRSFLVSAAAALAVPAIARGESASVLKFVPQADLAVLDPIWTTTYQTRDHGFLVFDTLFGLDSRYKAQPQMAAGAATEDDGKTWRITLRQGLFFHDDTKVLARDCVASIRRWGVRDGFGQALLAATDELVAQDDQTILFRLKRPFPLLPDALAKTPPSMCPIMPERLAATDPYKQVAEMIGSGPYRYVPEERVAGSRIVYRRNTKYVPRSDGVPDGTAGPKIAHFERIEWLIMPDPATVAAAMQTGEIDWWLTPNTDLLPLLKKQSRLKIETVNPTGTIATLRFNHLNPPFDNPAMRRAMLGAVDQSEYMIGAVGTDENLWRDQVGFFCPDTPLATKAGMDVLTSKRDLAKVKRDVEASGYNGEKIVVLLPSDIPWSKAAAEITADWLHRVGCNVEVQAMDWATLVQRRAKTEPVEQGGWSIFHTGWSGLDMINPAGHVFLRGNGRAATVGWPTSPKIEALRDAWFKAPDLAAQKVLADQLQLQAFQDVPYIPLGQYFIPTAYQADLTGMLQGSPVFWNIRRA